MRYGLGFLKTYRPPTYTYNARAINTAVAATTHTFTSVNIGTEDATRFVVVGIAFRQGGTISSVTIGGNAATALVDSANAGNIGSAFYGLSVPTGTTATVVVNHGTAISTSCGIICYSLFNLASTTPVDTAISTNATPADLSADTLTDAIVLGLVHQANSLAVTHTWTGLTERFDEAFGTAATWTGADDQMTSAETPRTISASFSAAPAIYRGGALVVMK